MYKPKNPNDPRFIGKNQAYFDAYGPSNPDHFDLIATHHVNKRAPPGRGQASGNKRLSEIPREDDKKRFHKFDSQGNRPTLDQPTKTIQPDLATAQSTSDIGDVEMAAVDLPGTGKPQGDAGIATTEYSLHLGQTNFTDRVNIYKKNFQVVSECFASKFADGTLETTGAADDTKVYLTSELLEIPWNILAMYMSPSEYAILDEGAHAIKAKCKVIFRGTTVKFETNATSTQIATLNTIQTLKAAVGLNHTGWGNQCGYVAFDSNDAMAPIQCAPGDYFSANGRTQNITGELYGSAARLKMADGAPVPCYNTGNFWIGRNYWCEFSNTGNANIGWPTARSQKMKQWDAKTMIDKCIVDEEYEFQLAPIKKPLTYIRETLPQYPVNIPTGQNLSQQRQVNVAITSGPNIALTTTNISPRTQFSGFILEEDIEKCQWTRKGPWGEHKPKSQPSINVGVQAMPQLGKINYSTGLITGHVQASAYFDVYLELHVKEINPTHYNYQPAANVPVGEEVFQNSSGRAGESHVNAYYGGLIPTGSYQ